MRPVVQLGAYTRDPDALFAAYAPEDDAGGPRAPRQPVVYRAPALRRAPPGDDARSYYAAATVDWWRGAVALFRTPQDLLNRTPAHTLAELPPAPPEHADVYVRETFAFLLRGHSLRAPGCTCAVAPRGREDRARAVLGRGFAQTTTTKCRLGTDGGWPTLAELALELAVADVRGRVEVLRRATLGHVVRLPLLRVLTQLAGLELILSGAEGAAGASGAEGGGRRIGLRACCVPRRITCAEDVAHAARLLAPRPYLYDPRALDALARGDIARELAAMQAARRLRVLESDTEGVDAVFCNERWLHLEPSSPSPKAMATTILTRAWEAAAPPPPRARPPARPPPPPPPPPVAPPPRKPKKARHAYMALLKKK